MLLASITPLELWAWLATIPVLAVVAVSIVDRDGWLIREAIAYLGLRQAGWASAGGRAEVAPEATMWLEDPANAGADPLERAWMLYAAGRDDAALATLARFEPQTPVDRVAALRARSTLEAIAHGADLDVEAVRAASEALAGDERRYQVLAAAWSQACLDVERRRPWRARFARFAREFAPYSLPRSIRLLIALQQLVPAVVLAAGVVVAFVVLRI